MKEIAAVKIGRAVYRVCYRRLLPTNWARLTYKPARIYLDESASEFETADSLIHEVLHGIWRAQNLPARASEEPAVTKLAAGLAQVCRDNPGLLLHLESLIKDAR